MPDNINISLLGESQNNNAKLVAALFSGSKFRGTYETGALLSKYVYKEDTSASIQYIFFQSVDYHEKDADEKQLNLFCMQSYSRHADVILYSVVMKQDENVTSFIKRAKQSIINQHQCDHADAHAIRYLVITATTSGNQSIEQGRRYEELTNFACNHGITNYFYNDPKYKNTATLFRRINDELSTPHPLSRRLGYLLEAILDFATKLIVYNPVAAFLNFIQKTKWNKPANIIASCVIVLLIPLIFPLYYLLSLLILPLIYSNRSGHRGWLVGLETPYYTIKDSLQDYPENLIASFFIIGLMAATILLTLGMFGTVTLGGIGLTALSLKWAALGAGLLGLGSGKVALSVAASFTAFVAGSVLYGVGYGAYLGIKAGFKLMRKLCYGTTESEVSGASADRRRDQIGPIEYYVPSNPVKASLPTAVITVPVAPRSPELPVASSFPAATAVAVDSFGPEAYRPVLQPASLVSASVTKSPENPTPGITASSMQPPPNARVVPYQEFPPRVEYPLSLRDAPLPFHAYPDPPPPYSFR